MIFLIDYDRNTQQRVRFKSYIDADRAQAVADRLAWDTEVFPTGLHREVVLLQAEDEAAVRRTHQRYFECMDPAVLRGIARL